MLGVILVGVTALAMPIVTWRLGALRYDQHECALLRKHLDASFEIRTGSDGSRPDQLISELAAIREQPARVVNRLNEVLGEIDYETQGMQRAWRACSRLCVTAGMAGACTEVALGVQVSSARAAILGVIALSLGIAGAVSCAGIGQWATRGTNLRRRLWDDFVQSILKSEFPQTAWTVRAPGLRPTNDQLDGQDR